MALDSERVAALHAAKLRGLVRSALGAELEELKGTDDGAVALIAGSARSPASVACLAQERPERALGTALAVAVRHECAEVHVFAEAQADVLARRAACFSPPPVVWQIEGANAAMCEAASRPTEPAPPRVGELVATLAASEIDVVVEHGVITGEVEGLEIARVVATPTASGLAEQTPTRHQADQLDHDAASPEWFIEVGVGAHDREAFGLLHADEPTPEAIGRVAEVVRTHRSPGAEPHPLNRISAARWLRSLLIRQPELVGADHLRPASPPVPRSGPTDPAPAVAYGRRAGGAEGEPGERLVVVCAVGIDLDVVPFAADARLMLDPDAALAIALSRRDAHQVIAEMAERLANPAEVIEISDDWRSE